MNTPNASPDSTFDDIIANITVLTDDDKLTWQPVGCQNSLETSHTAQVDRWLLDCTWNGALIITLPGDGPLRTYRILPGRGADPGQMHTLLAAINAQQGRLINLADLWQQLQSMSKASKTF